MMNFLIISYMLFGYIAKADTILLDPVFKPPQFTTAARPTCPSSFGCFGFNTTLKKFEWNDGILWQAFGTGLLEEWVAGKNYVIGETKNTGSDKNWFFKVVQDHTSVNVPADMRAGKLLAISPPIITTGVQDGGEVSLLDDVATVASGTGYIARYGEEASAFPRITIVEWATQTKTMPPTGVHTLVIDENGILQTISGSPGQAPQDLLISVAVVDMNLDKIYDRKTFPTNPVGQLRSLAFFFGGMTKGLNYTANATNKLQLDRSAHELYFWGADPDSPYSPNTKTAPPAIPVSFYEFYREGPVSQTKLNTFKTGVYDDGTGLVAIPGNGWGFARIYSSLGEDDYVMYAQASYLSEDLAKAAVLSGSFIKPIDLELTKFSAYFVFQKGDTDLSNNPITVCEPFGCDKIGTGSGGGGSGDVKFGGPTVVKNGGLAWYSGTTGKVISGFDNAQAISTADGNDLRLGGSIYMGYQNGFTLNAGDIRMFKQGSPYYFNGFGFNTMAGPNVENYVIGLPQAAGTAGQVLTVNNVDTADSFRKNVNMVWTTPTVATGDVISSVGSGGSTVNNIPKWNTDGKHLEGSNAYWETPNILHNYGPVKVGGQLTINNEGNSIALPTDRGTSGQALTTNGAGTTSWATVGTGDVVGPTTGTDNAIARYNLNGKTIQNSGVLIDDSNNISTPGNISAVGQIWSTLNSDTDITIDFNAGNTQITSASCGTVNLQNMNDGGNYTLIITQGGTATTCVFNHTGVTTVHYPLNHGAATASKYTVYSLVKAGAHLFVGWSVGI